MQQNTRPPRLKGLDYASPRAYFVTFCVSERRKIFARAEAAEIARNQILAFRHAGWYWLHAYAVMPNHVHLLLRLVDTGRRLGRTIGMLKSAILYRARGIGIEFSWQSDFVDHVVREHEDASEIVEYILRNPERAGLVPQGARYEYCGVLDRFK